MNLKGKTLFITGASRGIGKAIALRAARDGANIVVAAKTETPHPKLPGTIHSTAAEIEALGGKALPVMLDVRDDESIKAAVQKAIEVFGGIDIVVNNASAINLTGTAETPMRRYDLMMQVNQRGTFAVTQACLPWLKKAANPHILTLSPPPSLEPKWYGPHVAYTMSKMGMSLCMLGWAEEFKSIGIAANALWPRTVIDTAALAMLGGVIRPEHCRKVDIVADAAHAILTKSSCHCSGNFFIDEDVLAKEGIVDLSSYAVVPGSQPMTDLFLD
jgi:citronellol/citronellal dehydrogenase